MDRNRTDEPMVEIVEWSEAQPAQGTRLTQSPDYTHTVMQVPKKDAKSALKRIQKSSPNTHYYIQDNNPMTALEKLKGCAIVAGLFGSVPAIIYAAYKIGEWLD